MTTPSKAATDVLEEIADLHMRIDNVEQRMAGNMDGAEFRAALASVYRDARNEGDSEGFASGMAERMWLWKRWPLFSLSLALAGMLVGIAIGRGMQ